MKTLLIPPIPHLETARGRDYHLTLAHLYGNKTYSSFYKGEAERGKYIILDNSAHEFQIGQSAQSLLNIAKNVNASEIVLPDHLFDPHDTLFRTQEALDYIDRNPPDKPLHYMIVPQGESARDFYWCLVNLVDAYYEKMSTNPHAFPFSPVIGVSKDYEMWQGGLPELLEGYVIDFKHEDPDLQIHLLGWGRKLWDLPIITSRFSKLIRSVDSAKPYVYGQAGIRLYPEKRAPEYPTRRPDYFIEEIPDTQLSDVAHNIQVFDDLVTLSVRT